MRANPWMLNTLPKLVLRDWRDLRIYTEADLQGSVYFWLRRHFDAVRSSRWDFRSQPVIPIGGRDSRPDVVFFKRGVPYDAIELKVQLRGFSRHTLTREWDKLQRLKQHQGMRHAYQFVLYDSDEVFRLDKADWMKNYLTFIGVNVRRYPSGKLRKGYWDVADQWGKAKF